MIFWLHCGLKEDAFSLVIDCYISLAVVNFENQKFSIFMVSYHLSIYCFCVISVEAIENKHITKFD